MIVYNIDPTKFKIKLVNWQPGCSFMPPGYEVIFTMGEETKGYSCSVRAELNKDWVIGEEQWG